MRKQKAAWSTRSTVKKKARDWAAAKTHDSGTKKGKEPGRCATTDSPRDSFAHGEERDAKNQKAKKGGTCRHNNKKTPGEVNADKKGLTGGGLPG